MARDYQKFYVFAVSVLLSCMPGKEDVRRTTHVTTTEG